MHTVYVYAACRYLQQAGRSRFLQLVLSAALAGRGVRHDASPHLGEAWRRSARDHVHTRAPAVQSPCTVLKHRISAARCESKDIPALSACLRMTPPKPAAHSEHSAPYRARACRHSAAHTPCSDCTAVPAPPILHVTAALYIKD